MKLKNLNSFSKIFASNLGQTDKSIRCLTASRGEEALNKLKAGLKQLPDYIFLDLNMPRMSGIECLAEIKKINILQHIPVIVYSTSSAQKDVEETKKLGADYFITKPPNFREL